MKKVFTFCLIFVVIATKAQVTYNVNVKGQCVICKDRIEEVAISVSGIEKADYTIETNTLSVVVVDSIFDFFGLHNEMAANGHDTNMNKALDADYEALVSCCNYREPQAIQVAIQVNGNCGMCKANIEEAAMATPGVTLASWDDVTLALTVNVIEGFELEALHQKVAATGYDTDQVKASDDVYNSLAACCLYRGAQEGEKIMGFVYEQDGQGGKEALIGANLTWLGSGEGTVTDTDGAFNMKLASTGDQLVVSYVGYRSDTLTVLKGGHVEIVMDPSVMLETVEVTHRSKSSSISYIDPIKINSISKKELTKAACCNLSESFETTPSVDVSFTDAVTGVKTIQMLGLAGPYVQISRELMPDVRGLAAIYGMEYSPGPWIDKIDLIQGAGSVQNGYESIAGQINVGYYKPTSEEKLYVNAYSNQSGRYDANVLTNTQVTKNSKTAFLAHVSSTTQLNDVNEDGFIDMPKNDKLVLSNRWSYRMGDGWRGQAGAKYTNHALKGGQISRLDGSDSGWAATYDVMRVEGWLKQGIVFDDNVRSIGIQLAGSYYDQKSTFGNRFYDAKQTNFYANILGTKILSDDGDQIAMGLSLMYDKYDETVAEGLYLREEIVPGAYIEYNEKLNDKVSIVAGLRGDYHNNYGFFATPRLHIKYNPSEYAAIRFAAGRGQKTASIFAENIGMFASSRAISIQGSGTETPYGLQPEIAWNTGINYAQEIIVNSRDLTISLDFYHTNFTNKVVVDYDANPQEVSFYNLEGKSFSNSIQTMIEYNVARGLDVKVAYRMNDVQTDYQQGRLENPLIAKHRWFANVAYESEGGWKFDYTINRIGTKRIPITESNPIEFRLEETSPSFFVSNAQISKVWNRKFEVYLGGENLLNYRQEDPILSANDPTSQYFDSSLAWGPIFGRNIYAGVRYKIFNSDEYISDTMCD